MRPYFCLDLSPSARFHRRQSSLHPLSLCPWPTPSRPLSTGSRLPEVQKRFKVLGWSVGLGTLGWALDRYCYGEAVARTCRLAYNAGIVILDYKLNFNSHTKSLDELHERVSARISRTCIKNGGLYIKLGQSIAIQAAILPPAYKGAFEMMFDSAQPIPFQDVLKVWNQEFDYGPDHYFDDFEEEPIACGSIAQVHRARLKGSDEIVAVKVQRPNIPTQIEIDLFAYRVLLYVVEKTFELPVYFFGHYVSDQIRNETDFVLEGQNSERTAKFFSADLLLKEHVNVPKVHWPLTTKRILTTEFVEGGCRLTEDAQLRNKGLNRKDVMDLAMKMFSQMLFSHGWLHCDLHPGNVLVVARGGKPQLSLIDHGLYISLPDQFRKEYCELWRSLFVLDTRTIERIARSWGIANSELFASATLLQPFKSYKHRANAIAAKSHTRISSYESNLKLKETMKTMLENEALIPRELIFIVRCMRMMQGNNQALGSPTNRINILAHGAASGMKLSASSMLTAEPLFAHRQAGLILYLRSWFKNLINVLNFKLALLLIDFGFFITKLRQRWLENIRKKKNEGFEDLLQRQLENLAREEFGVTLDDSAFTG